MTDQPTLPGVEAPAPVGDPLGRCYTPDALADVIVATTMSQWLPSTVGGGAYFRFLEPSVGGGAFARAMWRWARGSGLMLGEDRCWPGLQLTGVDIDPDAAGLREVDRAVVDDWPTFADATLHLGPYDLVAGNPPWGDAVGNDVTIEHVRCAIAAGRVCVQVLPFDVWCVDAWASLLDGRGTRPLWWAPIRPRPWGERVRGTAVFGWAQGTDPTWTQRVCMPRWRP